MVKNNIFTKRTGFYAWPQFRILGIMAIVYGIYKLYSNDLALYGFEILLIIAGILANLMTKGIQLDFTNKKYREYIAVVGLKHGNWIKLPNINYVSVFNQQIIRQGGMQSLSYQDKHKVMIVKLVATEDDYYDIASFDDKITAMELGKLCAQKIDCKLLDYTNPEPQWIDVNNDEQSK